MSRYLVTGGAGFIGSHIVQVLLARGDAVTVLDDFSSGHEANLSGLHGSLEVIRGTVCDPDTVERAVRDTRGIFHQAALLSVPESVSAPLPYDDTNVHGTLTLLDCARRAGVRRLTLASSSAVYGDLDGKDCDESMLPQPESPYGASKAAAELYFTTYAKLHAMHTVVLRYFNVYGPRQDPNSAYAAAIPAFVTRLLAGQRPVVFGDGEQSRDFCFVSDVAEANLHALEEPRAAGGIFNLASGAGTTINGLLSTLQNALGTTLSPEHAPERPGDVRHSRANVAAVRNRLGYAPGTTLEVGLSQTVAHYRQARVR